MRLYRFTFITGDQIVVEHWNMEGARNKALDIYKHRTYDDIADPTIIKTQTMEAQWSDVNEAQAEDRISQRMSKIDPPAFTTFEFFVKNFTRKD